MPAVNAGFYFALSNGKNAGGLNRKKRTSGDLVNICPFCYHCRYLTEQTMPLSDEELITACRSGDEAAWETVVSKYKNLLFSIPRRAGLSHDLAADILQDVFTTLFLKLESLEKPEFLRAWLVTTTRYKTIHLIQRETRGRPASINGDDGEEDFEIPDQAILPDEKIVQIETALLIENSLAALDPRCRHLLTMLYLDDEQTHYADISEKLQIPLGSIGPTRSRCLRKLLEIMSK